MAFAALLDSVVAQFDLNQHPFYKDWSCGTLPKEKLSDYAVQYAPFVGTIALGWDALGEWELGAEERTHEDMWATFRRELAADATLKGAAASLASTSLQLFCAGTPEAIGALWAFESQQPHTSRVKLKGLDDHYTVSPEAKRYFAVHADDVREIELLRSKAQSLTEEEAARARAACASVCAAMWKTLDSIYYS